MDPIFWTPRSGRYARSSATTRHRAGRQRNVPGKGALAHLKSLGPVIYLRVPLEELTHRIHNLDSRGIALEPGQTLDDILAIRSPLYETYADFIVDALPGQELARERGPGTEAGPGAVTPQPAGNCGPEAGRVSPDRLR